MTSIIDDITPTPFDDVFKTECEKLKRFLVPLISELFGLDCSLENIDEILRLSNERYLITRGGNTADISKKFTDSCLRIGNKLYHVECQSTEDGSILVRLAEYNTRIGVDDARLDKDNNRLIVDLPSSALLSLRTPGEEGKISHMTIEYRHDEQKVVMDVPVMNAQAYSAEEIIEKKLYFLIPFYFIRYEKRLRELSEINSEECDRIYLEIRTIVDRLIDLCNSGDITEDDTRNLVELSQIILIHLTKALNGEIRERMVSVLGGQVLELQEDRWLKQGEEKGREEGKIIARFEDEMSLEAIAEKSNVSVEVVKSVLRDAGMLKE
jgi:hypothetical protein